MRWSEVVNLISVTKTKNSIGDVIENEIFREVFANKKSVRQSEFYQAMATGLKPETMFQIREADYQDEQKLKFDNKVYQIIRTHSTNGEILELVCEGLVS